MEYKPKLISPSQITFDEKTTLTATRCVQADGIKDTSAEIWPAGICLALYLLNNIGLYKDKLVIELGAGASFPAQICERFANKVLIQDRVSFYSIHLPAIISEWNSE